LAAKKSILKEIGEVLDFCFTFLAEARQMVMTHREIMRQFIFGPDAFGY
jgi:hypothetical protein